MYCADTWCTDHCSHPYPLLQDIVYDIVLHRLLHTTAPVQVNSVELD